jgi:hypothetical protein
MPTLSPLHPHHQLRRALEQLPNPEEQCAERTTLHLARETPSTGPHGGPSPAREEADVEFHRETLTLEDGSARRVWVYEGPVAIESTYLDESRIRDALGDWLRSQLGHRCVDVSVQSVDDHTAQVRVLATTEDELPRLRGA